jgi:hypothetical protein
MLSYSITKLPDLMELFEQALSLHYFFSLFIFYVFFYLLNNALEFLLISLNNLAAVLNGVFIAP